MQRSDKKKNEPADENTTMGSGNFISISIIAVIYVSAKIFITGDKIHNP